MATERSSLLAAHVDASHERALPTEDAYNRFSHGRKRVILSIVSLSGLFPTLVTGCFVPSILQISQDLNSTPAAVSLGVSLSIFSSSISVMFWSAYSSFYGRRMIYICGMPLVIFGSFAVAASTGLFDMLFWRFVQTFGCAGGYALGAATIGDIYKVEERGSTMGIFVGAIVFGLAIAPPLGGIFAQYWSWRGFQAALGVLGIIELLLLVFLFPETAHPGTRGIDKIQEPRRLLVWVNPLRCLAFLRSPNILAVTLTNTFAFASDLALLMPIAYTVGAKYGITDEGMIGILILPNGLGKCIAAPISGRISDLVVRHAKKERKGIWIPEDRLRAAWIGALVIVPVSIALAGFATAYIDGTAGLVISLICIFFNGFGVTVIQTSIGAYIVDIMPSRSAEVMAALTALRSLLLTPVSALLIPSVEIIGVAATNGISAISVLIGYALIWLTIRYGKQMRAYVDIGYPDSDSQIPSRDVRD